MGWITGLNESDILRTPFTIISKEVYVKEMWFTRLGTVKAKQILPRISLNIHQFHFDFKTFIQNHEKIWENYIQLGRTVNLLLWSK